MTAPFGEAVTIFQHRGGTLRMSDALRAGISRRTLVYKLQRLRELGFQVDVP